MTMSPDEMTEFAEIVGIVLPYAMKVKARMKKLGKRRGKTKCPQHKTPECEGPYLRVALVGNKDHLRMSCEAPGCVMQLME